MDEVTLGNGVRIPVLGLGTWQLTGKSCYDSVRNALSVGYTHIDTAEIYGNESEVGEAIRGCDGKRLFITSKVWHDNLRYDDAINACSGTLKRLKTNYVDLYLIHWPNSSIPVEETFKALKELHGTGKVRAVGVSNFTIRHLKAAIAVCKKINLPLTLNQVEFHPLLYQKKLLEFCRENRIAVTAYSPLARGLVKDNKIMVGIGMKYQKKPSQISLRWLIQKGIVAIPKASSNKHLKENFGIFDFELSSDDMERIDGINENRRLINPEFAEFNV